MAANTYSALVPELWSAEVVLARNAARIISSTLTRPMEENFNEGDTIHFPVFSNFTTGDANDDGTENTLGARTFSTVDLSIDKHKYAGAHYTKKELKQIAKNARYEENEQRLMGESLIKKIETDVLTDMIASAGVTINAASGMDDATLKEIVRRFDQLEVPQEDRFLAVDGYGKEDILAIDKFVKMNEGGDPSKALLRMGQVSMGFLGTFYGLNVVVTPLIPTSGGSPDKQQAVAYTTGSYGLAVQQDVEMEIERRAAKLGTDVVADTLYGYKALRATEIMKIVLN